MEPNLLCNYTFPIDFGNRQSENIKLEFKVGVYKLSRFRKYFFACTVQLVCKYFPHYSIDKCHIFSE